MHWSSAPTCPRRAPSDLSRLPTSTSWKGPWGRSSRPKRSGPIRWRSIESTSLELRLPLLEECLDAFLHVIGLHQGQELQEDMMDVLVERLVPSHAHHALGGLDGERCVGGDFEREVAG